MQNNIVATSVHTRTENNETITKTKLIEGRRDDRYEKRKSKRMNSANSTSDKQTQI